LEKKVSKIFGDTLSRIVIDQNFVLLVWEERNSGGYEHARACRERARERRAPKTIHQPSNDIFFYSIKKEVLPQMFSTHTPKVAHSPCNSAPLRTKYGSIILSSRKALRDNRYRFKTSCPK
jgi:hypothetical protein